ncbi:hypothetical protein [Sanguibacter sp. HDW7]|uniref:hypothetical protein n=1 Tax=Sanguibacter sp. HDW7 TaxID=2714931 RepID=UPI00140AC39A|nr:hypothetical protein [Sanguibacter sp. HDW7]QIK83007.1 hypothetical protein G7063_04720 [Sanguibacter sp. HDW7]
MSTTRTRAEGALVRDLPPSDRSAMLAPRGSTPVLGTTVSLWRVEGRWSVWSAGPEAGTWWLRALDAAAQDVAREAAARPDSGYPAIVRSQSGCIAVKSKEIRSGGR